MTTAITLQDITIYQVVEQQGPFFDVMEFFPTLTKELLEENRPWLQPTFIDPVSGRLVLCVQSFIIKTPHHNILIDSCVGNHKPRPARSILEHDEQRPLREGPRVCRARGERHRLCDVHASA